MHQFDPTQVKEFAKHNLDFFAALAMPDAATLAFPEFYHWIWSQLTTSALSAEEFGKIALGLPRGHGKTMLIKLFIVWCILYSSKRYVLCVGANVAKARAIISDVADCLDSHNLQAVYGNWRFALESDTLELKKFSMGGLPRILQAAGVGTSIRGSNEKLSRPDLMIFDDSQTKECAESPVESEAFHKWFVGTALKAKSPTGCTVVYIGNMYKDIEVVKGTGIYCCMLRNLQKAEDWLSIIVGAILADGKALWPELHPYSRLLKELASDIALGQQDIFFAEVLNDPRTTISRHIDLKLLIPYTVFEGELHQGSFIVIDPATSKQTPDELVIAYYEIYDDIPVCIEMFNGKKTAHECVHYTLAMATRLNCSLIVVESVAYQYELCTWFTFIMDQIGLKGIAVLDLNTGGGSKNSRILRMFGSWQKQEIRTSPATHNRCVSQATNFNPARTDNLDDILDSMEMAVRVASTHRGLIALDHLSSGYSSVRAKNHAGRVHNPQLTNF